MLKNSYILQGRRNEKKFDYVINLFFSTGVFSRTCPPAKAITYQNPLGQETIVAPPGWKFVRDTRQNKWTSLIFRVAAWGDHKHPTDPVRCYYYDPTDSDYGHVLLETEEFMDASHVSSWGGDDPLYYLCVSRKDRVEECRFV